MIKAKNLYVAEAMFNTYLKRLMRKSFSHFRIYTKAIDESHVNDKGVILVINHFSWWDGFFAYFYCKHIFPSRKIRMMMLQEQLGRYWFFRYLGCFSINPKNPKSIIESLTYAANEVNSQNVVVIYPQGKIEAYDIEQIQVGSGIRKITEMVIPDFIVRPLICSIKYGEEKLPAIEIMSGNDILSPNIKEITKDIQSELMSTRRALQKTDIIQTAESLW